MAAVREEPEAGERRRRVRAAGGVVWRPGASGGREVCVVHRPRYDDWSLPKGKLDAGEHPLAGAVREVAEETGVAAVPQARLPTVAYEQAGGVAKTVDYWLMRAAAVEAFTPNDEVDEVRWLPPEQAEGLLSYAHDAGLVRRAAGLPAVTAVVVLLRHAYAGERTEWSGPDRVRPLDEQGRAKAARLAGLLALFAPRRLVSATPDRCRQTLDPLAGRLALPVETDASYDEGAETGAAVAALRDLAGSVDAAVVVSQGKLIPRALAALVGGPAERYATPKGDGWLLAFTGADPVAADGLTAP